MQATLSKYIVIYTYFIVTYSNVVIYVYCESLKKIVYHEFITIYE